MKAEGQDAPGKSLDADDAREARVRQLLVKPDVHNPKAASASQLGDNLRVEADVSP